MSKLTKEFIETGAYRCALDNVDLHPLWSSDQLEASLQTTLKKQPTEGAVWLFAYGSLMWNPLLDFAESSSAVLQQWHRSFCIRLVVGRATAERPGRMLSLEPGGQTEGVAYRLRPESVMSDLSIIWAREMIGGVYTPTWTELELHSGKRVNAIAFVANPSHQLHEVDSSLNTIASSIRDATGPIGSNADYVRLLDASLKHHGFHDSNVSTLAAMLSLERPHG